MSELKLRPPKENANPRRRRKAAPTRAKRARIIVPLHGGTILFADWVRVRSCEEDLGFGFDDEEGV